MNSKKLLIIDDEPDFLKVMASRIETWGYEVIQASSGKEGLELLKSETPGIIVLDYMMPEMNGIVTLKKIREIDRKIPVIMFTAHPNEKAIKGTEKLGVSAFIPKFSVYTDVQQALKGALAIAEKSKK